MIAGRLSLAAGMASALAVAGCNGPGTVPARSEAKAGAATAAVESREVVTATPRIATDTRWADSCPIPSDAPRAPIGQTAAALVARYGPWVGDERFVLGAALDPVRMSVRNVLPAPDDLRRDVREMTWRARGCELTVWLAERAGREVAVQTMRAPVGGE